MLAYLIVIFNRQGHNYKFVILGCNWQYDFAHKILSFFLMMMLEARFSCVREENQKKGDHFLYSTSFSEKKLKWQHLPFSTLDCRIWH